MKAPDTEQFKEAMRREVNEHTRKGHWRVICKEDVPSHSKILPAVWSMKRKRSIETREVYKLIARLNLSKHKGVVRWTSIHLMLIYQLYEDGLGDNWILLWHTPGRHIN
jgi:hypothetical protein